MHASVLSEPIVLTKAEAMERCREIARTRVDAIAPQFVQTATDIAASFVDRGMDVPDAPLDELASLTRLYIEDFVTVLRDAGHNDREVRAYRRTARDRLQHHISQAKLALLAGGLPN